MKSKYTVEAAYTQDQVLGRQCVVVENWHDTIKEAVSRAKYVLTEDFRRSGELNARLGYSRIINQDGECLRDFFNYVNTKPQE